MPELSVRPFAAGHKGKSRLFEVWDQLANLPRHTPDNATRLSRPPVSIALWVPTHPPTSTSRMRDSGCDKTLRWPVCCPLQRCGKSNRRHAGADQFVAAAGHREHAYLAPAVFFASAITASKAGLGWLLPSNKSGLPKARQETASFTPQNVTTFTDFSCFRNARKRPA